MDPLAHLSEQTHRILTRANEEALGLDDEYVGTHHVLLALLGNEDSPIALLLGRLGVHLDAVRREVEKLVPAVRSPLHVGILPRAPRVRHILEEAVALAREKGENRQARPDHLLLALLHDREGAAAAILRCLGAERHELREAVLVELSFPLGITTTPDAPRLAGHGEEGIRRAEEVDHLQDGAPAEDAERMRLSLPAVERPLVRGPLARFWALVLRFLKVAFPVAEFLAEEEPASQPLRNRRVERLADAPEEEPPTRSQGIRRMRPPRNIEEAPGFAAILAQVHVTDQVRKVIQLANQEAHRFNHEYIGTEHLLLGLIKESTDVAAEVLTALNIDLRVVRLEVEKIVLAAPELATLGKLPTTTRARLAVKRAVEEAFTFGQGTVGTEHLLLGLLLQEDGVASQVLRNLGVSAGMVREVLFARLRKRA
jgi:hypothetical protein